MLIPLQTDTTSPVTHPSSENLLTLIIITGGLLFICLVLLVIVMLRSKARRKKLSGEVEEPMVKKVKEPKPKKESFDKTRDNKKKIEPKPEPKKEVVEVTIKKEEPAIIVQGDKNKVETKKEEVKPVVEVKKEIVPPAVEKKEEVKPPVVDPSIKTSDKKPDEVIIKIEEKKEDPSVKTEDKPEIKPSTTSIEEKKDHFRKVLSETHSKEDNLKILQERLAELSKEKKTTVTFKEDPSTKTTDSNNTGQDKKEESAVKKDPVENVKLVDLTALINEKLQGKTEKTEAELKAEQIEKENLRKQEESKKEEERLKEEEIKAQELRKQEELRKAEEEKRRIEEIKAQEESHKIITPFIDKIKEKHIDEEPEKLIEKIDEELKAVAEKEIEKPVIEKTIPPATQQSQNSNEPPKTFTEWLSTLKK